MPKKSNWLKHDIRVAALIYQALNQATAYSDEDLTRVVNDLFPRALVSIGRIRHGRLLLQRLGVLDRYTSTKRYFLARKGLHKE